MFHLIEPLFDIAYLGLVIALGIRLFLEKNKSAKRFSLMTLLLGLGDAFHLIPRVISHLSPGGFEAHISLLSWGELMTGITMTLFYLLFYYYYRELSKDDNRNKTLVVYALVALRIALLLLPQNEWGTKGNYTFGLIRNIPFAILGILLILWTWKYRKTPGLQYTAPLIFASFLFYLPVVIGARFIPALGALMIPKTVAYIFLVVVGYKHFLQKFEPGNLFKLALTFAIMGLIGGVFYREFTKAYHWTDVTRLSFVHLHLITLGFLWLIIVYLFFRKKVHTKDLFKQPITLYVTGLIWTVVAFTVRGIYEIIGQGQKIFPDAALSGIAGIGHILLSIGLIWMMSQTIQIERQ